MQNPPTNSAEEADFYRWPISASPYLRCHDRLLDINDGRSGFTIDWRGDWPVYTHYTMTATGRVIRSE